MPRVAFLDLGRIGSAAASSLADLPEARLLLMDGRPVRTVDVDARSPFETEDVGRPRHEALRERLRARRPDLDVSSRTGPDRDLDAGLGFERWAPETAVLSAEVVDPARLWKQHRGIFHRGAFARGAAVLAALALGDSGWLGPLGRPGRGPCLRCAYERVRAAGGGIDPFASPAEPDPEICARLTEAVVEQIRSGEGERETQGPGIGTAVGFLRYLGPGGVDVRHPLLRTPHCPECGDTGPFLPYRFPGPLPLDEPPALDPERGILDLAETLISPLTGPLVSVEPDRPPGSAPRPGDPRFEVWRVEAAEPAADGRAVVHAGGCAQRVEKAQAAALGEAVERLASRSVVPRDLFTATLAELGDDAVDPRAWDVFHPRTRAEPGFPYPTVDERTPLRWIWGHALDPELGRRAVAVPVAFVGARRDPRDRLDAAVVSGFATATSYAEAAWRGLREVLERDAFMIAWANRLPLRGFRLDAASSGPAAELRDLYAEAGLEVRAGALELDLGVHLVVAQCRSDRPGDPASVIAAGCDPDPGSALCRALEEVAAGRLYVRGEMRSHRGPLPRPEAREVTSMSAHGLLYARPEMRAELDPWWSPEEHQDVPEPGPARPPAELLGETVARCRKVGLEHVLVVDLTPPEIRDLGLRVVKTLVPGTYPMNFDSRWPHFGGPRLGRAPVEAGLLEAPLDFEELRRVPHPFP